MANEMKRTVKLRSYPPHGWTPAQWASAERIEERFNRLPLMPWTWMNYGEYIGKKFETMFIGIERDGYAHS